MQASFCGLIKEEKPNTLPTLPGISEGSEPMQLREKEKVGLAAPEDAKEGALATALKPC